MSKLNDEILEYGNEKADEIANDMGFDSGEDLVEQLAPKLESKDTYTRSTATRTAGTFVAKLSLVIFEQIVYGQLGTSSVYS